MMRIRPPNAGVATALVAVLAAFLLGYVNLHNDEAQASLLVLLAFTFLLGFLHPRRAWARAVIVGLAVPLSSLLALKTGLMYPCRPGHPYSCEPMTVSTALSTVVLVVRR